MKIEILSLATICPSAENSRRPEKDDVWKSFVESVKQMGVTVPIEVYPVGDKFEIVAGHRRFRAAKEAGYSTIPAIVSTLSPEEVREHRIVENLQRRDLAPLEEGEQVSQLLQCKSMAEVAKHIGKSVAWIYQRAQLVKLCKSMHNHIKKGSNPIWSLGALLQLARMPDDVQAEISADFNQDEYDETISEKDVTIQIERRVHLLKNATWDLNAKVIENCCVCALCPKRTGNQRQLFVLDEKDIKKKDACLDQDCWMRHVRTMQKEAFLAAQEGEKPIFVSDSYAKATVDLQEIDPKKESKNPIRVPVLGNMAYRLPVGKEKGVKAIDIKTGKTIEIILPKPDPASKTAPDGTKIKKDMSEKREALDKRRVHPVIEAVRIAMLKSSIKDTTLATDDWSLLRLVATHGTDGGSFNMDNRDAIVKTCLKAEAAGFEKIDDNLVREAVWARLKCSINAELYRNKPPTVSKECIDLAIFMAGIVKFDWDTALAKQVELQPEPKSWAAKTTNEKKPTAKKASLKTQHEKLKSSKSAEKPEVDSEGNSKR